MNLEISQSDPSQACVFALTGEVDVYTAPELKQRLVEGIESGCKDPIIDMSGVDFIDSTGLGVLVGVLRRVKERGGSLRIAGASDQILRIFTITGLDRVFAIYTTVAEASAAEEPSA